MSRRVSVALALFLLAAAAGATPVISEFMASNTRTLVDSFGDSSDWIEIYNPDAAPTNLAGWHLTDDADVLSKWTFPSVTMPSRGTVLVFASGRDAATNGELHANFSLDKDGEYLGLVQPDGITVASEFAPPFAVQFSDVSYGTALPREMWIAVSNTSPCRALVPTNAALGTTWRQPSFDDSSWPTGRFAVGYFTNSSPNLSADLGLDVRTNMYLRRTSAYIRAPFVVSDVAAVRGLRMIVKYDDGFACFFNGQWAMSLNAPAEATLNASSTALGLHNPTQFETNDLAAAVSLLQPGTNWMAVHGLNANLTSSDLFFQPRLELSVAVAEGVTGYFNTATPRAENGGNETIALPQRVTFSHPSGVYTGAFALALGGSEPGQFIRYTLDGGMPSVSSAIYTGGFTVASSRHVRARVFAPNGQAGLVGTAQYTFLDPSAQAFRSSVPLLILRNVDPLRPGPIATVAEDTACVAQLVDRGTNGEAALAGPVLLTSRCGVNIRGSSTQWYPKKPYSCEFWGEDNDDADRPFLDMPADSDWVLSACYDLDRSFLHDALMFDLSRQIGRRAPRTRFVEVFLVTNAMVDVRAGDYLGLYVVEEKIKVGKNRADIVEIEPESTGLPDVTGGYLFKIDRQDADEYGWHTTRGTPTDVASLLVIQDPKNADLPTAQIAYLTGYIESFENALYGPNFADPELGYARFIDVPAWIDHHLLNLLPMNVDALRLSAYMCKDRSGPIVAGPVWDFDRSLDSYDDRDDLYATWSTPGNGTRFFDYDWWGRLFADPAFRQRYFDRWQELRRGPFATSNILATVDWLDADMGPGPPARDAARWPGSAPSAARGGTHAGEIAWLKTWVSNRAAWIDAQLTAPPAIFPPTGAMASGSVFSVSGGGTIYFTLDGSDPCLPSGGVASNAVAYAAPVEISTSLFVVARSLSGTNWSGPVRALYLVGESFAASGDVAVTEVHYNPLGPSAAERAALPDALPEQFEFVEIRNVGSRRVNLYECGFDEGAPFGTLSLGAVSLGTGDCAVAVRDLRAFRIRYGTNSAPRLAGEWGSGSLADGGEAVTLRARDGSVIHSFAYGDSGAWPGLADGRGSSLEYAAPEFSAAAATNPASWRPSSEVHGSPGTPGAGPDGRVLINEWLAHTDLPYVDAVELFNPGEAGAAIGGWLLSDSVAPESADDFRQFVVPSDAVVPPGGWLVFDETDFAPNGLWNPDAGPPGPGEFRLDAAHGEELWLIETDAAGRPRRFVDRVAFGATLNGESLGRWPDGAGEVYPLSAQTLAQAAATNVPLPKAGGPNAPPRVGPVLVGEVHYRPAAGDHAPFIEVFNAGAQAEDLSRWTLRGDVDVDFPPGLALAAGEALVLVPFAPADAAASNAFVSAYRPRLPLRLFGPWPTNDGLSSQGRVALYRADTPPVEEPWFHPQALEDEVEYAPVAPWPAGANGAGASLTRLGTDLAGRLPGSWAGEAPSPGTWGPLYDAWAAMHLPGGGGAADDDDGDGAPNLFEYFSGGDPSDAGDGDLSRLSHDLPAGAWATWYRHALLRPGAACVAEQSTNLLDWTAVPDAALTRGADYEIRGIPIATTTNDLDIIFFRVNVLPLP
jgi:hypothetical protein